MSTPAHTFHDLGIAPEILHILAGLKFTTPTPIQHKAIPVAVTGQDVIGIAQTGTGKTLAFGIPLVQRLAAAPSGKALILVPTRELALQVNETLLQLALAFKMRTAVLIGGESLHGQLRMLKFNPRIVIATPGRLNDHLGNRNIRLDDVSVLVLDEADRMLDMGFYPQIERVLHLTPSNRQTMLFSATMPGDIVKLASAHMHLPVRAEIAPSGTTANLISQELFVVSQASKARLLSELLKEYTGSVLLFVRTRRAAAKVSKLLMMTGQAVAEIHADRSLSQRKNALRGFKAGEYRILVATDIAARGIDVTGISVVINYDLPDDPENYVHRIGRTGRAGQEGHAITLATPDQGVEVKRIERIIRAAIPRGQHDEVPAATFEANTPPKKPQQRRVGGHGYPHGVPRRPPGGRRPRR